MMCFQTTLHDNFTYFVQNAVSFLKIPSMGTPYSVREMLFQRLKECLALLVKVSQITDSEVPFPAQHIPLQGFNQHIRNIIAGVNNGRQFSSLYRGEPGSAALIRLFSSRTWFIASICKE